MGATDLADAEKEFSEIYQRNVSRIYRLCFMYLKNTADAEDAVQSVFLKLLRPHAAFRDLEHEKAWLITVAKNCCRDMLKSWWKSRRVDLSELPEAASPAEEEEEREVLEQLLGLPEKYRIVLHLYYLEDYSVREIAGLLGSKESTVRTRLCRGREKLKIKLEGGRFGEYEGEKACEQDI